MGSNHFFRSMWVKSYCNCPMVIPTISMLILEFFQHNFHCLKQLCGQAQQSNNCEIGAFTGFERGSIKAITSQAMVHEIMLELSTMVDELSPLNVYCVGIESHFKLPPRPGISWAQRGRSLLSGMLSLKTEKVSLHFMGDLLRSFQPKNLLPIQQHVGKQLTSAPRLTSLAWVVLIELLGQKSAS